MHKYYDIYTNRTLNSLFTFKIFNYYLDIRYIIKRLTYEHIDMGVELSLYGT